MMTSEALTVIPHGFSTITSMPASRQGTAVLCVEGVGRAEVGRLDRSRCRHLLDRAELGRLAAEHFLDLPGKLREAIRVVVTQRGDLEFVVAGVQQLAVAAQVGSGNPACTDDSQLHRVSHERVGAQTIQSVLKETPGVSFIQMALDVVRYHHEWFNGEGYPYGIKGEEIPLSARIAALADVYDALTTNRAYKAAFSHEKTMSIIRSSVGTQFDPVVVEALVNREKEFMCLARFLGDDDIRDVTRQHGDTKEKHFSKTK